MMLPILLITMNAKPHATGNHNGIGNMELKLCQLNSVITFPHPSTIKPITAPNTKICISFFLYLVRKSANTIRPNKANLTLNDVEVSFLSKGSNYQANRKKVSVDILVSTDKRDQIIPSDILVIGNLVSLKKGVHKVELKAELPEGVNLLKINPSALEVTIK